MANFDAALDRIEIEIKRASVMALLNRVLPPDADDDVCVCRRHAPTPSMTVDGDWRRWLATPTWSALKALDALGLPLIAEPAGQYKELAASTTEDLEGYTSKDGVWLRPDAHMPIKTAAHEIAHNVLGHVPASAALAEYLTTLGADLKAKLVDLQFGDVAADVVVGTSLSTIADRLTDAKESATELTAYLVVDALGYPDPLPQAQQVKAVADYVRRHLPMKFVDRDAVKRAAQQVLAAGWLQQEGAQAA